MKRRRAGGFTLVETLIAAGVIGSLGVMCAILATAGTSGMRVAWGRSTAVSEASVLFDRIASDVRGASTVSLVDASTLRVDAAVTDALGATSTQSVRYTITASASGAAIAREFSTDGATWKMEPMRPIATFVANAGGAIPVVTFTISAPAGRVTVRVESDELTIEETTYARFG
ncbi:MAG: type II secretion system protein J [bacterium]